MIFRSFVAITTTALVTASAGTASADTVDPWARDARVQPETTGASAREGRRTVGGGIGSYGLRGGAAFLTAGFGLSSRALLEPELFLGGVGAGFSFGDTRGEAWSRVVGVSVPLRLFPHESLHFRIGPRVAHLTTRTNMGLRAPPVRDLWLVGADVGVGQRWDHADWYVQVDWANVASSFAVRRRDEPAGDPTVGVVEVRLLNVSVGLLRAPRTVARTSPPHRLAGREGTRDGSEESVGPPLVVLVPPEQPPALVAAMETSCSSSGRPCHAETGVPDGAEPEAELVWLGGDQFVVVVRVRARSRVRERTLRFSPADPALERWRAAGLALGVLAAELPHPAPSASASASAPAAPPPPPPTPPALPGAADGRGGPPAPARLTVALGAVATSGVDAVISWGGELRITGGASSLTPTVAVGATAKRASGSIEQEQLWVSAGVAWWALRHGPVLARLRGEAGMERLSVALRDGLGAGPEDRWVPLLRGGADAWTPIAGAVSVGLGADLGLRVSARVPTVYLGDEELARTPRLRPSGSVWLAYAF